MATDSRSQPQPTTFPASKIPLLLRAVTDPEGRGEITPKRAATIQQIETNLAAIAKQARPRRLTSSAHQSRRPDSNRGPLHYESVEKG